MKFEYDAIVIGSGLGGLTAGALVAHAGYQVLVLEQNATFGGAATTYHSGDLTIEASLHETTDPRTTVDPKGEIFQALDLYKDVEFVSVGDFYEVRCPLIGAPLTIPHDLDTLGVRLIERFSEQSDSIHRFLKQIDSIQRAMEMFMKKHGDLWWLAHGPELPLRLWSILRNMRSSLSEVLERYFGNNEAIKFALAANLSYYADDPDHLWWLFYAVAQGGFLRGGGYYLKGGSQALSDRLIDRIRKADGVALENQVATKLQLDNQGNIVGVHYRARSGGVETIVHAPIVFANASPHAIGNMLPKAERERFMAPYREKPLSTSLFSMTLGLNRRPSELGVSAYSTKLVPGWMTRLDDFKHCATLLAHKPSEKLPVLSVVDFSRIETGLTNDILFPINIVGLDRLANWQGLNEIEYNAKKKAWINAVINRLDIEWPGFANAVVQQEMATARTMHEFLGTPGGAVYGFAPNVPNRMLLSGPPRTPKTSINGLWLASAFAGAGGFTGAMSAGAAAAKSALHELT